MTSTPRKQLGGILLLQEVLYPTQSNTDPPPKLSDSWALQAANVELMRQGNIEAHIGLEHILRSKDAMVDLFHFAT